MAVIVPCLHTSQPVGSQTAAHLAADAIGREQRLDPGANSFRLEVLDGPAGHGVSPTRHRSHADGLLSGGGRNRDLAVTLQKGQVGSGQFDQWNLVRTRA
ncbi:MAG: hypothetical protein IAE86_20205 [Burkholderiaceae bacterium]|nr:hypothetical protein [Burkholderiaceae bacterium]